MRVFLRLAACAAVGVVAGAAAQPAQPSLLDTEWQLIDPPPAAAQRSVPSLRLQARQFAGSDGCNRMTGRYQLDGERIAFPQIGATRMACPDLQGSDAEFAARLTKIEAWRIREGVLELLANDAPLLRFQARSTGAMAAAAGCTAPVTQADMNSCAYEDFLAATADYSAAYTTVADALPSRRRALFRRMQTEWIRYRTAACNFEASGAAGGSAQPMVKSQCDARMTRARTAELRAVLDCKEGDVTCVRPKP